MDTATQKLTTITVVAVLTLSTLTAVAFVGPSAAQVGNAGNAAVSFADQPTDGTTVTVESVNVSEGGFVAIHNESLLDGDAVGSVVGVSEYLEPGNYTDVTVTLFDVPGATFDETALTENQTLIAMPHRDTDGNETYDFVSTGGSADGPYLDDAGQPVTDSANVTVVEATTGESFTVDDLTVPAIVQRGTTQSVNATVTNPNDVTDTQPVTVRFQGDVIARQDVTLGPGESTTVTTPLNTSVAEGTYFLGVYTRTRGQPTQVLIVDEVESFGVASLSAPATATVGETITVNATVTNPNPFAIEQLVEFRFQGDRLAEQTVSLPANGSTEVTFSADTTGIGSGTYIHSVFTEGSGQSALISLSEATPPPTDNDTATVAFADQESNGTTVTVESVNVSEGGFVAIHNESLLDGDAVGSVVGVSEYLEPGNYTDVTVTLFDVPGAAFEEDELEANETLIAMPHRDTNANEQYDFVSTGGSADGPYLDDGQPVTDSANITVEDDNNGEGPPSPFPGNGTGPNGSTTAETG